MEKLSKTQKSLPVESIQEEVDALVKVELVEPITLSEDLEEAIEEFHNLVKDIDSSDMSKDQAAVYNKMVEFYMNEWDLGSLFQEEEGEEGEAGKAGEGPEPEPEKESEPEGEPEPEPETESEPEPEKDPDPKPEKPVQAKEKKAPKSGKAKPKAEKKQGKSKPTAVGIIVEQLKKARKASPVTKEQILKILVEEFPDRPEKNLASVMNQAMGSYLKVKHGLNVVSVGERGSKGYYIGK